jgi:DNA-directed RNA polymerase II subunit RPB2
MTPQFEGPMTPQYGATTSPVYGTGTPQYGTSGSPMYATGTPMYDPLAKSPQEEPKSPALYAPRSPPMPVNLENKLNPKNPNTILSRKVLQTYFETFPYPFTRHHIDSYDQFIAQDLPAMIKSHNPILLMKERIQKTNEYQYRVEIFVGGETGDRIEIGTPTIQLQKASEVRVLFPNEARLRNLTYASMVYAHITVKVYIKNPDEPNAIVEPVVQEFERVRLFQIPICLHSRYCILHGKPSSFLKEAGECPQDQGGYFIIDGGEKVLVTRQEQAFNTFYVTSSPNDKQVETKANIFSLSPITRDVQMVGMYWMRKTDTLHVTLPYILKPIPVFVLFRALGYQTDEDILKLVYPNLNSSEAKGAIPLLLPSIAEAQPFVDTISALQFLKAMTKGFSIEHVYDILFNKMFIHIPETQSGARAHFLADCVRKFMRVHMKIDPSTDRDDTRNQRCQTTGFLIRLMFQQNYSMWMKSVRGSISEKYEYNPSEFSGQSFLNLFTNGSVDDYFIHPKFKGETFSLTNEITRAFKGKWAMGGGQEAEGALQPLGRQSYLDFMSHCRRVHLNFDTGDKSPKPRQLHTSQYGYYCTNETPGGKSIGITKNLSLMTLISSSTDPTAFIKTLFMRGWCIPCHEMRPDIQLRAVPVFVNNGLIGYTLQPRELNHLLQLFKRTACLPPTSSVGFSIRNRKIFIFTDEGRPCRPLLHITKKTNIAETMESISNWNQAVVGTFTERSIVSTGFLDPLAQRFPEGAIPFQAYFELLEEHTGVIEYLDPYEQNEAFIVNFPEHIVPEATHMEIHPCTIVGLVNGMIPFANYNQSPRNQLSCAQSKQAVGMYATNFQNRYDGTANILCYGESPLVRTLQYDIVGEGAMPYGHNVIMAIMPFHGFNRDDGIIFNKDSFDRGMFRTLNYRSYSIFEENDLMTKTQTVIAHPLTVPQWTDLKTGADYSKLDERGIIRVGEIVDENTILVSRYIQNTQNKSYKDASLKAQVWTSGRVESVVLTVSNQGLKMVQIRITQDRIPELGDKFSTRHGQKGTIGMLYRSCDLPRTKDGLVPDMLVNPHCIPSRMTVAQLLEIIFGKICYENTMIGDATLFMSDEKAPDAIGRILENSFGMERASNEVLYDGESGRQMPTTIFMGPCFAMRLKHMVEDKWNARAEGRREQRTHQPTGGRGNQGGLRIGELERDTLIGHSMASFTRESFMERSDKTEFVVCNGCGTLPIYNEKQGLYVCSLCDGPVTHFGSTPQNMELLPPTKRSQATFTKVEMPYVTKLIGDELNTYLNMGMRIVTAKQLNKLVDQTEEVAAQDIQRILQEPLKERIMPDTRIPEYREPPKEVEVEEEDLVAMGLVGQAEEKTVDSAELEEEQQAKDARLLAIAEQKPQMTIQIGQPTATAYEQASPVYAASSPEFQQSPPQYNPFTQQEMGMQQPQTQTQVKIQLPTPGAQQVETIQPLLQGGGEEYYVPEATVYRNPIPNGGGPTITIDTGGGAMAAGGFAREEQLAARGVNTMGGRRHTTPHRRPTSPSRVQRSSMVGGQAVSAATKVSVRKIE